MLATIKKGEAAARRDYRMQLACERITQQAQEDTYVNAAMQRGIDLEDSAVGAYMALTGNLVATSGFLVHDTLMAGCSLDGDVDDLEGIIEVKCPKSSTHLGYLETHTVPANHLPQITHNLWITGAKWCDFVSYDDRFPAALQLFVARITPNEAAIEEYEARAMEFLQEVDETVAHITQQALGKE